MSSRRVIPSMVAAVTLAGAFVAGPSAATAAPNQGEHYVALGDSFAAGSVVFPQSELFTCARSAVNYPALVAQALHVASFKDVSCGSATLDSLANPEAGNVAGVAPPQFDALTPDTTLVTLTMGGNDIGLASKALRCVNPLPQPYGTSCAESMTAGGRDIFDERIRGLSGRYDRALDQIHLRAPKAKVVVVGYPTVSRPGGCPEQPAWPRDIDYMQKALNKLNALLRRQAVGNRAIFVDTASSSVGHDMCAAADQQWVNGLIPSFSTPSVMPLHPNTLGQQNIARQVLAAIG